MVQVLNTHQAKTQLSKVLAEIEETGKTFTICRNGKPIADVVPTKKGKSMNRLKKHPKFKGKIKILYDPTAPLSDDEWPESEIFPS